MRRIFTLLTLLISVGSLCAGAAESAPLRAKLTGNNLMVSVDSGDADEMCFCFRPCMQNKLMTFSHVGLRESLVDSVRDPSDMLRDTTMRWLNSATSDNIGPVGVNGYANFVGGNHLWQAPDEYGTPGKGAATKVLTAVCDSFLILADGAPLASGVLTECRQITVEVWNTLMDPLVPPLDGAKALHSPLIGEHARYTLEHNTIVVDMEHSYYKDFTVSRYYGMQSMFVGEDEIFTPSGVYRSWTIQEAVLNFKKSRCPWLSHFVERQPSGWCQTTWLMNDGLGSHEFIQDDAPIFVRGSRKCYHVLMNNTPVMAGERHSWRGAYVWSRPDVDDDFLFMTRGRINGRELVFIDTKCAGSVTIARPEWWNAFYMPIDSHDITITGTADDITITATKASGEVLVELTETDAVRDIGADRRSAGGDVWHTMQGQRIAPPSQPGIYVHNGAKVLITP